MVNRSSCDDLVGADVLDLAEEAPAHLVLLESWSLTTERTAAAHVLDESVPHPGLGEEVSRP